MDTERDCAGEPAKLKSTRSTVRSLATSLRDAGRLVLDTILPPQCPITGEVVDRTGLISASAWSKLQFIGEPQCDHCGLPFPYDPRPSGAVSPIICGACSSKRPAFDRARAALIYDEFTARLILGFKYGDRTDGVKQLCRWMVQAGQDILQDCDALVPVPLHYTRQVSRRFNQAAVLAFGVAREVSCPVDITTLQRHRPTPQQKGLGFRARRKNVRGAFTIKENVKHRIQDKAIVLVDDVLTTGATVDACATLLKRHGARKLSVLTVARVVSELRVPI